MRGRVDTISKISAVRERGLNDGEDDDYWYSNPATKQTVKMRDLNVGNHTDDEIDTGKVGGDARFAQPELTQRIPEIDASKLEMDKRSASDLSDLIEQLPGDAPDEEANLANKVESLGRKSRRRLNEESNLASRGLMG